MCLNNITSPVGMLDAESLHRQPLTHTKKLGTREFAGYLKSQVDIANTLFSVQKYLENHPVFYLHSLLHSLKGKPLDHIKQRLQQQYKELVNGCSFYHRINASIQARSKCINKIKRDLTRAHKFLNLFPKVYFGESHADQAYADWVEGEGYSTVEIDESISHSIRVLSSIFVDMSRLRDMTIYIVETVHGWRAELEDHLDRCQQHVPVHYYYQGKQLYEMILEDTGFLWVSKLSDYIWMEAKQDPFLMRNLIHIQERTEQTILEKYFVEIMTPKRPELVDKALKCFEMLVFKYKPKLSNRFEEEELLIQNYLNMEKEKHMFDQPQQTEANTLSQPPQQQETPVEQQKGENLQKKRNKLSSRGWVFDKSKQPTRSRVKEIIEKHKDTLHVRPYNISNDSHKQQIAMAYLSEVNKRQKAASKVVRPRALSTQYQKQRQFMSEGEQTTPKLSTRHRQVESEPESRLKSSKMFKSLTKLGPVIYQDPKEYMPDTPTQSKNKNNQWFTNPQPAQSKAKINSFVNSQVVKETDKIEVDQEETPLNMKKFYQVFRADTDQKPKQVAQSTVRLPGKQERLVSIKEFLDKARKERAKSIPYGKKAAIPLIVKRRQRGFERDPKRQRLNSKSKSLEKSRMSYRGYEQVQKSKSPPKNTDGTKLRSEGKTGFMELKPKTIPFDLIIPYVRHLIAHQHTTSRSFSAYQADNIISKLADPFVHSIIFDLINQQHRSIGQIVLSESVSGTANKLKYTVEFLNMHTFEAIVDSLLRVSEELLATTPCEEVVCPFVVDKLDIVSAHFVENLDRALSQKVGSFGRMSILERSRVSGVNQDTRERLYIFTSDASLKKQYDLGLKMMSCYRSLRVECKCFVLTSNFRLKSTQAFTNTLQNHRNVAIGQLFVNILGKILTKYHLKQLKQASYSLDSNNQLTRLLKSDTFVRNIMASLAAAMKQNGEEKREEVTAVTGFNTIDDLLNYLVYKQYDQHFAFKFLEETRFMPHHELVLAEFDQEVSLEFTLTSNQLLYTLHNHKRLPIVQLTSSSFDSEAFLLPTTHSTLQLFMMPADEFKERTDSAFDLYSYFCLFQRTLRSEQTLHSTPSVIIPNLSQHSKAAAGVRMYDGLFRLFPERQFYSGGVLNCFNHWEGYYPDAVVHTAKEGSLMFNFPFFMGFYDSKSKTLASVFLFEGEGGQSPSSS